MLERGKVTETGTHEELMAIPNGKYAELCRLALGQGESKQVVSADDSQLAQDTPLPESRPPSPLTAPASVASDI